MSIHGSPPCSSPTASYFVGDNIEMMRSKLPKESVQTFIVDPPYGIGFDYGCPEIFNDKFDDYPQWIEDVARECFIRAKDSASFFLIHYPEAIARLLPRMEAAGWSFHQWITWVYPSNIGMSKRKFTTASRVILWMSKGEPKFNHVVKGVYKNPGDKRIKQRIAEGHAPPLMDWWEVNLCKNVSSDYFGYKNQIPFTLLERLILNTTDAGDLVADVCAGSGSTLSAANQHMRNAWGCDLNPEAYHIWRSNYGY